MPKLVFQISDSQSLDFPLAGSHVRLGRNAANDIVIDNSWISSFHAEFKQDGDGVYELRDLNSSNGTSVNGERITALKLRSGDRVSFGQLEAIFDPQPAPAGVNGTAARSLSEAKNSASHATAGAVSAVAAPAAIKGPRLARPGGAGIPVATATTALPRPAATEPVPAQPAGRLASTGTTPISPGNRQEVVEMQSEVSALRAEARSLSEKVETLRREREAEEQTAAQLKLQGEREARELRGRLEKLQQEIEQTEIAAAEAAKNRSTRLTAEDDTLSARIAEKNAAAAAAEAALQAQNERLVALRKEEASLSESSNRLAATIRDVETGHKAILNETAELNKRREAALAAAATAGAAADAAHADLAAVQKSLAEARRQETEAAEAKSAAETELQKIKSQAAELAATFGSREAELAALTRQLGELEQNIQTAASQLAGHEKATAAARENFARATTDIAAVAERRSAAETEAKAAETKLAALQKEIAVAGDKLREVEQASAKLAELNQAIAEAGASAEAAQNRKAALESEIASALAEQSGISEQTAKLAAECRARQEEHAAAAGEHAKFKAEAEAELAALRAKMADEQKSASNERARLDAESEASRAAATHAAARLAGMEDSIVDATARLAELEARAEKLQTTISDQEALLQNGDTEVAAILEKSNTARTELEGIETAIRSREECRERLAAELASMEAEKEKLAALKSEITRAGQDLAAAETSLTAKQATLAKLDMEAASAEAAAKKAREAQADAVRAAEEVAANQEKLSGLLDDISALAEKRASAHRALSDSQTEHETLSRQIEAARIEAAAGGELRAENERLETNARELAARIAALEDRVQTFGDAPDANWATVHLLAKSVIKQLDLYDDLLAHLHASGGSREVIEQHNIFRAGLMGILTENNVEAFHYPDGFTVDLPARKRIQIVESSEDGGSGTRIEKTYRPGYVCTNGQTGTHSLLRKTEVAVFIGK